MMHFKSLVSPVFAQLRTQSRAFHLSPAFYSYPLSKTGKLLTPYIRFSTEKRADVLSENPNITTPEVGRKLGELWRSLPESERQRYKAEYEKAKADKAHK